MKREKIFSVLISLVISILMLNFTLRFTNLTVKVDLIVIWFAYFSLACAVSISILAMKKNKKLKTNYYQLLTTINSFLMTVSFIFALQGEMTVIKNIAYYIFVCEFIMHMFFCGLWLKAENKK